MNKRIAKFLYELAEENERLEDRLTGFKLHVADLLEEIKQNRKEIKALKVKIRQLNKEKHN